MPDSLAKRGVVLFPLQFFCSVAYCIRYAKLRHHTRYTNATERINCYGMYV